MIVEQWPSIFSIRLCYVVGLFSWMNFFGMPLGGWVLAKEGDQGEEFIWYERQEKQVVYLQKNLMALFPGQAESENEKTTSAMIGGKMVREFSGVKIVSVSPKIFMKIKGGQKMFPRSSPVFSPTRQGSLYMALPGGVILDFDQKLEDNDVLQWAERNGLKIKKTVPQTGRKIWMVETAPGTESLHLANELKKRPEVKTASPNWWRPMILR